MNKLILLGLLFIVGCQNIPAPQLSKIYYQGAIFKLKKDNNILLVCTNDYYETTEVIRVKALKTGEYYLINKKELLK